MKIAISSGHAGYEHKKNIIKFFEKKYEVINLGKDEGPANYAIEGIKVAETVASGGADFGVVICGSGIGISIAANKVRGIRCAVCYDDEIAKLSRQHNNANLISIGARFFNIDESIKMIDTFLSTKFEGERHEDRVNTICDYETSCVDC